MRVTKKMTTKPIAELNPGDTFEMYGDACIMTMMRFVDGKGICETEEEGDEIMRVAVKLENGEALLLYEDEEVSAVALEAVVCTGN